MNIEKSLYSLQDKKYQEFQKGLCPGVVNIIGVRIPELRKLAKELLKKYTLKELLENINDNYYEELMLQGMVIGWAKEDINTILKYVKEFVPKIDNWAVCDTFCTSLKITKKYKEEMWEFIQKYLKSDKEFELRFAIVMILGYFIDEKYLEKDFKIFNNIKSDKYYVKMALAWAISICVIKYYDRSIKYLEKEAILDDFTYNKAIQKARESYRLSKEQKDFLNTLKK